jgi:hypothetical protein
MLTAARRAPGGQFETFDQTKFQEESGRSLHRVGYADTNKKPVNG